MGQSSPEFIIFCLCMFVYGAEFGWVQLLSLSTGQSLRLGPTSRLSTGQSLARSNFSFVYGAEFAARSNFLFVYGAEFGWDQLLVCLRGRVWLGPTSRLSTGQSLAGTNFSFVYGAEFGWDQLLVCLRGRVWLGPTSRLSMGQSLAGTNFSFVERRSILSHLSVGRRSILSFVCGAEIHLIVCLWGRIIKQWELISAGKTSHKHDNKHNQKDLSCLR